MHIEPANPAIDIAEPAAPVLAVSPHATLTVAPTRGARVLPRCPPVHSILLGKCHLTIEVTETFGAPPRTWRAWFKLRRAIGEPLFGNVNLTQAAHRAGFADSAHLTRTCKQLTGVTPAALARRAHP